MLRSCMERTLVSPVAAHKEDKEDGEQGRLCRSPVVIMLSLPSSMGSEICTPKQNEREARQESYPTSGIGITRWSKEAAVRIWKPRSGTPGWKHPCHAGKPACGALRTTSGAHQQCVACFLFFVVLLCVVWCVCVCLCACGEWRGIPLGRRAASNTEAKHSEGTGGHVTGQRRDQSEEETRQ